MSLIDRINSEYTPLMEWEQYKDLLIDVLNNVGFSDNADHINSVFSPDLYDHPDKMLDTIFSEIDITDESKRSLRSLASPSKLYTFRQQLLSTINNDLNWVPAGASWYTEFEPNDRSFIDMTTYSGIANLIASSDASFTRASSGWYEKFDNTILSFTSGNVRHDSDKGLLIEPSISQYAGNNYDFSGMVDGVIGSGASLPDHVLINDQNAIFTFTVTQVSNYGIPMIQMRIQGTNNTGATRFPGIKFNTTPASSAAQGENWFARCYLWISGGNIPTGGRLTWSPVREMNGTTLQVQHNTQIIATSITRHTDIVTLSNATTDRLQSMVYVTLPDTQNIDITITFGMWELYKDRTEAPGAPVIITIDSASGPVIKQADEFTIFPKAADYDITVTFDDDSTQVISGQTITASGWEIPTNLNRPYIKNISAVEA